MYHDHRRALQYSSVALKLIITTAKTTVATTTVIIIKLLACNVPQWLNYSTKGGGSLFPGETAT